MNSTFRPAAMLMLGRMVGFVFNFLTPIVMVRLFDQLEFGTYKQLFLLYSTVFVIAQLGMAESLFYFLPQAREKAGRYILNSLVALLSTGLCALAALELGRAAIGQWLSNPALPQYVGLLGTYLCLTLASAPLEIAMIARGKYLQASIVYPVSDIVRNLLFMVPAFLHGQLRDVMIAGVVFAALRFGATLIYATREFGSELKLEPQAIRRQLTYALPFALYVGVDMIIVTFPQYIVAHRFDAATFAIFAVGCTQIPVVDYLVTSVGSVMMVRMGGELRACRRSAALSIWSDLTSKLALILFPLMMLLLISARDLITLLFTAKYADSVPLFMVWSTLILFETFPTDGALRVYADTKALFAFSVIRLVVLAALSFWFFYFFGLIGGVLVSIVAIALYRALCVYRLKQLMHATLREILPWKSLVITLACAMGAAVPVLAVLKLLMELPTLARLIFVAPIYGICYLGLLHRAGQLDLRSYFLKPRAAINRSQKDLRDVAG